MLWMLLDSYPRVDAGSSGLARLQPASAPDQAVQLCLTFILFIEFPTSNISWLVSRDLNWPMRAWDFAHLIIIDQSECLNKQVVTLSNNISLMV